MGKSERSVVRVLFKLHGLADKGGGVGRYLRLRQRQRRPMRGMLLHLDASTHEWITGLPLQDLVVALDDADGQILFARFFPQEGVASTLTALLHVLRTHGRFSQLYTERGSHFCRTEHVGEALRTSSTGTSLVFCELCASSTSAP